LEDYFGIVPTGIDFFQFWSWIDQKNGGYLILGGYCQSESIIFYEITEKGSKNLFRVFE